mgnify:CR=1 FL=1
MGLNGDSADVGVASSVDDPVRGCRASIGLPKLAMSENSITAGSPDHVVPSGNVSPYMVQQQTS